MLIFKLIIMYVSQCHCVSSLVNLNLVLVKEIYYQPPSKLLVLLEMLGVGYNIKNVCLIRSCIQ